MPFDPETMCGAETRKCLHCGHMQKEHRRLDAEPFSRRGPCGNPACTDCPDGFVGRPCERTDLMRGGKCYLHGGKSLSGMASPSFEGKGYSGELPGRLADHYETVRADPNLLSLRDEIAYVKATLHEVTDGLREGTLIGEGVFESIAAVSTAHRNLQVAHRSGDATKLFEALTDLTNAVHQQEAAAQPAQQQVRLRKEVREIALVLDRLSRAEMTHIVDLHGMVTADAAFALQVTTAQSLVDILNECITDKVVPGGMAQDLIARIRTRTSDRLAELVGRRDPKRLGPGDDDESGYSEAGD